MSKFTDITPEHLRCPMGDCPSVFRSEDGSKYQVTGRTVESIRLSGDDHDFEAIVEIDAKLLEGSVYASLISLMRQYLPGLIGKDEFISAVIGVLDPPQEADKGVGAEA